jgi:sister chromatid cohesion protein DCC1
MDLTFSPTLDSSCEDNEYLLLDLTLPDIKQTILHTNNDNDVIITIKGSPSEDAILCTKNNTYTLRSCETSNELLLIQPQHPDEDVFQQFHHNNNNNNTEGNIIIIQTRIHRFVEPIRITPRFNHLHRILGMSSLKRKPPIVIGSTTTSSSSDSDHNLTPSSSTPEDIIDSKRARLALPFDELLLHVQASSKELSNKLNEIGHFETSTGGIRIADKSFVQAAFHEVLLEMKARRLISTSSLDPALFIDALQEEFPAVVVRLALLAHCTLSQSAGLEAISYTMDSIKIGKFVCEHIFTRNKTRSMIFTQYREEFFNMVPEDMLDCTNDMIIQTYMNGIAIILSSSHITTTDSSMIVEYFPVETLPTQAMLRFDKIFQLKSQWTFEEIFPYLDGCDGFLKGEDPIAFLKKFTRVSVREKDGVKVYSKR